MDEQEIKAGLESLVKKQIVDTFSSLAMNQADTKSFLVESVLTGEPTDEEIEVFKALLAKMAEDAPTARPTEKDEEIKRLKAVIDEKDEKIEDLVFRKKAVEEGKKFFIVVHAINEDGRRYEKNSRYDGEKSEYFLAGGQIRASFGGE